MNYNAFYSERVAIRQRPVDQIATIIGTSSNKVEWRIENSQYAVFE